ncbi:DUF3618 domain-containing protein [Roseibacillus ishigakijimensis]|uniref:DUF3618 domain-containing protein n=1 Tax=Roseibacillus ishigakijimensis TaxID=454146 RepID=A0A934VLC7_9BACT|nr:DUF3618 domain-containing protein [Roseibacillus ishigakijimensis]MBK1834544.1 DUF3618 domain-containing protein [Roseibacillus ishigakijimensis]
MNNPNDPIEDQNAHAEAIENDIESTRQRMDSTWQKLAEKAEPNELLSSLYDWMSEKLDHLETSQATEGLKEAGHKAGRFVRENPVPLALGVAAVGSAFLPPSDRYREMGREANERLHHWGRRGRESAREVRNRTAEKVAPARMATERTLEKVSQATSEQKEEVKQASQEVVRQAQSSTQDHPLVLCAGAALSGFALGLILPKSEKEEKLYGKTATAVRQRASQACRSAVTSVRDEIRAHRLDREGLQERAKEAVDRGADQAEEALDEVSAQS